MIIRYQSTFAPFWIAAGLLVGISTDASAQQRMGAGAPTNANQGGGQGIGGGGAGIGGGGGALGSSAEPSAAVTGQLSRSEDRMLSDVGGGAAGAGQLGGLGGLGGFGGAGGAGGIRGMGGFGGLSPFGANPFGGGANATDAQPAVRTRLRIDSPPPVVSGAVASGRISRQLGETPVRQMVDGLSVVIVDGVATLSGTASNEKDRRMAELVLRLEPGVREIENQIVVAR